MDFNEINYKIRTFRDDLVTMVNNSGLPLYVIDYIFREVQAVISQKTEESINNYKQSIISESIKGGGENETEQ